MKAERGAIAMNILLVIVVLITVFGAYLLVHNHASHSGQTMGLDSPMRNLPRATDTVASDTVEFSDGLPVRPDKLTEFELDEFGSGPARQEVFFIDIDGDGHADRITRTRVETGTSHYSDEYKIELRRGNGYIDITPPDFKTMEGAECTLQKLRFVFRPDFQVIKISRPWSESWTTPTQAEKTLYAISDDALRVIDIEPLKFVCRVEDLF